MAGAPSQVTGVSNGAVNGARAAYDIHAPFVQENVPGSKSQSRTGSLRQNSSGSSRMPLSNLVPNRKGTNEYASNLRPSHSRIEELGQQEGALSRSGSEPDSLLDLYRHNASNGNVSSQVLDSDIPENMWKPDEEDPDGWIHRDKLAKIESEELQAAGINLANARRQYSKSGRRTSSRDRKGDDGLDRREEKKPRLSEPALEEEEDGDERAEWDLRNPEEIAAEAASASQIYTQPLLRKSGSRIPVLTSSPNPIPSERLERDTPLPRKRTMSNSMSPDEGISIGKQRTRKESIGSQGLLDARDSASTPVDGSRAGSKPGSPTKARTKAEAVSPTPVATTTRKVTPATARKTSVPVKITTIPTPTSSSQRPVTRGNDTERPKTAVNRPEGDPPWLETMYKPDPSLPPDQQIIPTHARKQQAAQWEEEGAIPKTYDRSFSPIAIHEPEEFVRPGPKSPTSETLNGKAEEMNSWPLKPMASVKSNKDGRPGTSGSITAGYSTMPKVTSPPIIQSPRMGSMSGGRPSTQAPTRLQDQRPPNEKGDDGTVKKGCGCCVVM